MEPLTETELRLAHLFSYHAPTGNQLAQYHEVRAAALAFARVMLYNTPVCADQTAALRYIRIAVMTANAAIALGGIS